MRLRELNHPGGGTVLGVDAHTHVLRVDAEMVPDRHSGPSRDAGVDELLGLLDTHGLSHAVVTAPSFYGTDNHVLLDALAQAAVAWLVCATVASTVAIDTSSTSRTRPTVPRPTREGLSKTA